ncbi:AAA family ATPase [Anoxynatronum buryatiense]|uniref:ATP-binding protein n=1 Tax=Anoxynatronum buryatiense TaxID=489973 RepID=A0AA45WUZ6_9CLOT|nr:ATP-binding protein [Anoxynatronum buryatiense]SMP51061.1 hypothetical protein SAMN06296020_10452 [Anoxynatronum buryatiense]
MNSFVNREAELQSLEKEYARKEASFYVLYGRRRVGKTRLIQEFIRNKPAIYLMASEEMERENMLRFRDKVADFTGNELLKQVTELNWEMIFQQLVKGKPEGRPIIVIDEFQYLSKSNKGFPSLFQRIWDECLQHEDLMLILCGSLITMIESQVLHYSSPLYGRRTAQWKLKPIGFNHYHYFFQQHHQSHLQMKDMDLLAQYAVTGGVPKYIEIFQGKGSLWSLIRENMATRGAYLLEEPIFLLEKEVSEIGSYMSIMKTIAHGHHKLGEISAALNVKPQGLSKYLSILEDLDLIRRQVPVTEENPAKSKKGLYEINDHFIKFWFLFIYPYREEIEAGQTDQVMKQIKDRFIEKHAAFVYEEVCRQQLLEHSYSTNQPFRITKIGKWWNRQEEIDIVGLNEESGDIIFGECKFTEKPVSMRVYQELQQKAESVQWHKNQRQEYFVLFSKSGFTNQMKAFAAEKRNVMLWERLTLL